MENSDLRWIKKHYSETLMHLCRDNFPTLLEREGLLKEILSTHFNSNRHLGEDIIEQNKTVEFKNFIYSLVDIKRSNRIISNKSAVELMDEAGYILYPECKSEEDIQAFRHYYAKDMGEYKEGKANIFQGEELCTFKGGRLNSCRVFFAVKKDVDKIKREDFTSPKREDEYGTSVLSIQFSKDRRSTLSIKNRYNHSVNNPDATFSNNLDNIIFGLSEAFCRDYNISMDTYVKRDFELDNYVRASDGKYYRYNMEINNVYYCDNNVIIDNFEVKRLENRYVLMDYFIVDLSKNTIRLYDNSIKDSFIDSFGEIEKINLERDEDNNKVIRVKVKDGEDALITINDKNQIIKLYNPNMTRCGSNFMSNNTSLRSLDLPVLRECGDNFMYGNVSLTSLNLPVLKECGNSFMCNNKSIGEVNLPRLEKCGFLFMRDNNTLTSLNLPVLRECGSDFMQHNNSVLSLKVPSLERCGSSFMLSNRVMKELDIRGLKQCDSGFMCNNKTLKVLDAPSLRTCEDFFMMENNSLVSVNLPSLESCGCGFLSENDTLTRLSLPSLRECGSSFLLHNNSLTSLSLPHLTSKGSNFMESLSRINKIKIAINNRKNGKSR